MFHRIAVWMSKEVDETVMLAAEQPIQLRLRMAHPIPPTMALLKLCLPLFGVLHLLPIAVPTVCHRITGTVAGWRAADCSGTG